ncbi:beta-galactosidase [Opitutaceae bacterium EW11]|nr:beta-galactosidase [Opitutaceae bacterium EW11]
MRNPFTSAFSSIPVSALAALCLCVAAPAVAAAGETPARERISINEGWRFHKGDPVGEGAELVYDVRPAATSVRDDKPADSKPEESEETARPSRPVLKPWILPTGNPFIKDPARRFVRPDGNPGSEVAYVKGDFDDSSWRPVTLPHDWAIEGPFIPTGDVGGMGRLPSPGIGWYRKALDIPKTDAGRCVYLEIDGAMSYATVWLNGHLVGGWPYGYSSWNVDLTPYLMFGGDNQLAIRLDNPPASSRWYPGGGLYRNVWLTKTRPVHVGQWGTFVTARDVSTASATVELEVTVANACERQATVQVSTQLFALDSLGRKTGEAVASIGSAETRVASKSAATVKGLVLVRNPRLWGPPPEQKPQRYVAVTSVTQEGQLVDLYETRFGIRSLRFDPASGLLVNGQLVKIRGVNNHHDLGALGAAFNRRAAQRQLEILREMGCNAVRMSHNPPAPELLELTDEMGFLVMDEAFDIWELRKNPLDFHLIFPDWHEQDLRAMVRRDRNSPSVVIWSVGNEVGEQYTGEEGARLGKELCEIVHEEDPTRPTTAALNFASPDMPLPAAIDVIGLNYQGEGIRDNPEFAGTDRIRKSPQYSAFHARFPGKVIVSTETASAFSSRGVYLFPVSDKTSDIVRDGRGGDPSLRQVTAYELHAVDFGSSADKVFGSLARHPFVAGEFVWTGFDYLGEPTPYYTSRSSYSGIVDLAGFKKDRFYLYQSVWRPDLPLAHILPHWTWPERRGQVTPVHVFTSGDAAELFLNGRSLGRKAKGNFEYRLRWDDVVYEPGKLEVVAYKDGAVWAKDAVVTAQAPAMIDLVPDRAEIAADGCDLAFVTARVADAEGVTAPRADNRIVFRVDGPGELVATDNGDPTDLEAFPNPERKAFSGLCLAIVRAKRGQAGKIVITASSDGLKAGSASVIAAGSGE